MNWKKLFSIAICLGKAFFNTLITVVWGLSSFFLLAGLMTSMGQSAASIASIIPMITFVQKYWMIFFAIIFIYNFIVDIKALDEKKEAETKNV